MSGDPDQVTPGSRGDRGVSLQVPQVSTHRSELDFLLYTGSPTAGELQRVGAQHNTTLVTSWKQERNTGSPGLGVQVFLLQGQTHLDDRTSCSFRLFPQSHGLDALASSLLCPVNYDKLHYPKRNSLTHQN